MNRTPSESTPTCAKWDFDNRIELGGVALEGG